jgi:hypothetical protein
VVRVEVLKGLDAVFLDVVVWLQMLLGLLVNKDRRLESQLQKIAEVWIRRLYMIPCINKAFF